MTSPDEEYARLSDLLESASPASAEFADALVEMEALAENGFTEAAEAVAEILAFTGEHRNPEKAYIWYHIAFSTQGYTTQFEDQNNTPPYYCGPVGDFRNEAQVNSLVAELGFARTRRLDKRAEEWLRKRPGA